ncbi:synembryn [Pyrococcus furiosus]|uniref:synembryn n=1 Tax=Pyrococcus furiosus TaxID=2261 RepID=UPI001ED957F7|nr:synembryn [Pyrococcus furiosus]
MQRCLQQHIKEIAEAMGGISPEDIKWEEPYGTTRGSKRLSVYYSFEKSIFEMTEEERESLAERMASEMKKLEKATKKTLHRCRSPQKPSSGAH